ncbi:MAG: cupredoxin domain-containing protein [Hydrotalea sp.]|nr:cupredoxin domain-containing protein [Hydrotalea sp.]
MKHKLKIVSLLFAIKGLAVVAGSWWLGDEVLKSMKPETANAAEWTTRYDFGAPIDKNSAEAKQAREVVLDVPLNSYKFNPADVRVKKGEVIKFVIKNHTKIKHEFVLGDRARLDYIKEEIAEGEEEEEEGASMTEVEVKPGKVGVIYWQFLDKGEFLYICLIPEHEEHGMRGKIIVK